MILQMKDPILGLITGHRAPTVQVYKRLEEGAHQPRPNSSLVVSRVPVVLIAGIPPPVVWVTRGQGTKTIRRKEMLLDDSNDPLRSFCGQHTVRQTDGKDLVRTDRRVAHIVVDHVVEVPTLFIPERPVEIPER